MARPNPVNDARARARARALLRDCVKQGDVAIEGKGGNLRTYELAAEIQSLGISPTQCLALMMTEWNGFCQPPWSDEELPDVVKMAARYAPRDATKANHDGRPREEARS